MGYSPWDCKELDTTEQLNTRGKHTHMRHTHTRGCASFLSPMIQILSTFDAPHIAQRWHPHTQVFGKWLLNSEWCRDKASQTSHALHRTLAVHLPCLHNPPKHIWCVFWVCARAKESEIYFFQSDLAPQVDKSIISLEAIWIEIIGLFSESELESTS